MDGLNFAPAGHEGDIWSAYAKDMLAQEKQVKTAQAIAPDSQPAIAVAPVVDPGVTPVAPESNEAVQNVLNNLALVADSLDQKGAFADADYVTAQMVEIRKKFAAKR